MSKLLEKNGAEMANALVSLSVPIKNFMDDTEFCEAFKECTKKGVRSKLSGILRIYTDLVPFILGDKHLKDTLQILAIVEGKSVNEMLKMNGTELLADAMGAWKEQIEPFLTQLGLSV